jgi:hypothetical protein
MKNFLLLLIPIFFSCTSNKKVEKIENGSNEENLIQRNCLSNIVAANHEKIVNIKGDFNSFKKYIEKLDNKNISSIPIALDYIKTCLEANSRDQDSIFFLFNVKFYSVANNLSDSFESGFPELIRQLNEDTKSTDARSFLENIKYCGLDLCMTEGTYYFDVTYDYFYNNFKDRVSPGIKEFLDIRKDELKQGFSEDAGMLITFDDLYQRVKRWDIYIAKYPNSIYSDIVNYYHDTYLETLLTGMDNSRIFDLESDSLDPEVKLLYEKIIREGPESKTTDIISNYYAFLSRHNFAEDDSIDLFLKSYGLSTMLAVQPHTR